MPYLKHVAPAVTYIDGKELELYPFVPGPSFSAQDCAFGHTRGFDTDETKYSETKARTRIEDNIRVTDGGNQILQCTVVDAPREDQPSCCPLTTQSGEKADEKIPLSRSLVAKVFDYEHYPSGGMAAFERGDERAADEKFRHELSVYKTGYPHVMPQFYGGWVMKIENRYPKKVKCNDDDHPKFRYVCLLLIEFIEGRSVEDMCFRKDEEPGYIGDLIPLNLVIKKMLYGLAVGNHLGVTHGRQCEPSKVSVTMMDGNTDLDELRVVFLNHSDTQVPKHRGSVLAWLPYPPHPAEWYDADDLGLFVGWWPPSPRETKTMEEYDEEDEKTAQLFGEWMCSKEVFGPIEEADDVMDELERTGRDWPHEYPKFSTNQTMEEIREELKLRGKKRKREQKKLEDSRDE
ncbi:hypothetical protein CMUS01_14225 [Colletotrichum musicola]|uniref:Protein kinase domain-containing protein n=1 Tax=Colletotrichum musicola TaxID=2175873 RepID=A0A8H6MS09_9PEZI|nr:hypothetical protein CMUS01_14225 [Colletotrichum musicola]